MVVYNVSFFRNNRIDKLALRGHITFPRHSLLHSMRVVFFDLAVPARHSFACCAFPPFRRIYSVVPRQWKKHHILLYRSVASQSFASHLLSTAYGPSRPLRFAREILYVASISRLVASSTRMHTHAWRYSAEIAISSPAMNNDGAERSCIRSLHWARSEIYDTM